MSAPSSKNVLLTGSTGFIGQALLCELSKRDFLCITAVRTFSSNIPPNIKQYIVGDINSNTIWKDSIPKVDTIIHLAGRAHILNDKVIDPLETFREINSAGTLNLARQGALMGVRRFIFISSIGVNGNKTDLSPFTAEDIPAPVEAYALSKYEAEVGLREISDKTGMEIVIIRPPLVYGPNAPGNFARLIKVIAQGIPLPFGSINNQRSLVAIDSLVDLIIICINHPSAANQTFMVSDGEDFSTTQLTRRIGKALGKPTFLLPVPETILVSLLKLIGKDATAQRLCNSLQVDITKTRDLLNWKPIISADEALTRTAQHFLSNKRRGS